VKQQIAYPVDTVYAEAIGDMARGLIRPWHWWLGRLVVFLRDRLFGPHPLARNASTNR
jgi:hypothetical protein